VSLASANPAPVANANNVANVGAPAPLTARDRHGHHAPTVKRCGGCGFGGFNGCGCGGFCSGFGGGFGGPWGGFF
ncbi:hypothetical protein LPJ59_005369, partial [Coemansia sp. RSA 2399]